MPLTIPFYRLAPEMDKLVSMVEGVAKVGTVDATANKGTLILRARSPHSSLATHPPTTLPQPNTPDSLQGSTVMLDLLFDRAGSHRAVCQVWPTRSTCTGIPR